MQTVVSLAIVVGIFVFAFPQFADYGDVWTEITAMTLIEIVTLLAVAIWNLVTYWFVLTAVMPGLTYPQAAVSNQASTAVANTMPGGGAIAVGVTYAMYRSWGFGKSEFALAAVVSGVWNNFAKLGMPVLALALLALEGEITATRVIAAVAGIGVLIGFIALWSLFLYKESLARRIGASSAGSSAGCERSVGKPPVSDWDEAGSRSSGPGRSSCCGPAGCVSPSRHPREPHLAVGRAARHPPPCWGRKRGSVVDSGPGGVRLHSTDLGPADHSRRRRRG